MDRKVSLKYSSNTSLFFPGLSGHYPYFCLHPYFAILFAFINFIVYKPISVSADTWQNSLHHQTNSMLSILSEKPLMGIWNPSPAFSMQTCCSIGEEMISHTLAFWWNTFAILVCHPTPRFHTSAAMVSVPRAPAGIALMSPHLLECRHPKLISKRAPRLGIAMLTSSRSVLSTLAAAVMKSPMSIVKPGKPRKKNQGGQCFMTVFKISWKMKRNYLLEKGMTKNNNPNPNNPPKGGAGEDLIW